MAGIEWMRSRGIETENGYVKETEFRLTSKLKALELLGRHLGMFTDRVELSGLQAEQGKLEALIQATTKDMRTAETAILRMANDQYRRVVFDAQVYAASGAGTYEKAVDMATHDMLAAGLNCVQYKNGARHTLADYADMAIRNRLQARKASGRRADAPGMGRFHGNHEQTWKSLSEVPALGRKGTDR